MNHASNPNLHKLSFRQGNRHSSSSLALNFAAVLLAAIVALLFAGLVACGLIFVVPLALVPAYAAMALTARSRTRLALAR